MDFDNMDYAANDTSKEATRQRVLNWKGNIYAREINNPLIRFDCIPHCQFKGCFSRARFFKLVWREGVMPFLHTRCDEHYTGEHGIPELEGEYYQINGRIICNGPESAISGPLEGYAQIVIETVNVSRKRT